VSSRRLEARERRTVAIGVIVSVVALLMAFGVLPLVRRISAREDTIAASEARLARLRSLTTREREVTQAARERSAQLDGIGTRLLSGRTTALAASSLQALLQDYARAAQMTVSRLDVAGAPDTSTTGDASIPATIALIGDVYGLADLMTLIQNGPRLLEVRELTVTSNSALRGDLLQVTVAVRGPFVPE